MAIKQYSLKADGARKLAPGFKVREFRCRDGSDVVMIDQTLVVLLQAIREHFGKPITITSGYRTAAHNAAVGGAKSSQHLLGRAADIQVLDTDPLAVAAALDPSLVTTFGFNLQVDLEGPFRGRTIGDRSRLQDPDKHTQVALGVDVPEFLDRFMGRVTAAAR